MGGSTTNHFNGTCHVPPQQFLNHQTRLFRQEIFEKWWFGSGLYIFPIYCESSVFALTKGIQPEQDIQNFSWKGNIYAPTKGVYKLCTNFWILSESSFAWRRTSGFLFFKVDVRFHKEALSTNIQNKKHNIKCLVNTKNSDLLWSYLTKVFPPLPVMIFSSVKKLHLSAKKRGHLPPLKSPIWFSANHRHPAP